MLRNANGSVRESKTRGKCPRRLRRAVWRCPCPPPSGLLCLLSGQIQAADVQQGLRVSRLGHRARLDSGLGLHDLHPHGGRHQDHPIRRTADRGGRSRCGRCGSRIGLVVTLDSFFPACCLQRIKAVAAPVRGGASSRPRDHHGPRELTYPLDPNGNSGGLKAPTHIIVETMM